MAADFAFAFGHEAQAVRVVQFIEIMSELRASNGHLRVAAGGVSRSSAT